MHDKRSWEEMHAIEVALGREIVRVETGDFDKMEKVSFFVVNERDTTGHSLSNASHETDSTRFLSLSLSTDDQNRSQSVKELLLDRTIIMPETLLFTRRSERRRNGERGKWRRRRSPRAARASLPQGGLLSNGFSRTNRLKICLFLCTLV